MGLGGGGFVQFIGPPREWPGLFQTTPPTMAHIFVALFLLVFGLNLIFGLGFPTWLTGSLALIAGVLLLMERFRVRVDPRR